MLTRRLTAVSALTAALLSVTLFTAATAHASGDETAGIWKGDGAVYMHVDPRGPSVVYIDASTGIQLPHEDQVLLDLSHSGNSDPRGVWANSDTVYVSDWSDEMVYAYSRWSGEALLEEYIFLEPDNWSPEGIWAGPDPNTSQDTLWVADSGVHKLFAYSMANGQPRQSAYINLDRYNSDPAGIHSNGQVIWVTDIEDSKAYAYDLKDGTRLEDEDQDTPRGTYSYIPDLTPTQVSKPANLGQKSLTEQSSAKNLPAPVLRMEFLQGTATEAYLTWGHQAQSSPAVTQTQLQWTHDDWDTADSHYMDTDRKTRYGQIIVTDLPPDKYVSYRVRLIAGDLYGPWSNVIKAPADNPHKKMARRILNEVVSPQKSQHPWLQTAWDHLEDNTMVLSTWNNAPFDYPGHTDPDPDHLGHIRYRCYARYGGGYPFEITCDVDEMFLRADPDIDNTAAHELAHVYTLSVETSPKPPSIAAAMMYFMHISDGSSRCIPEELYADTLAHTVYPSTSQSSLYYWSQCHKDGRTSSTIPKSVSDMVTGSTNGTYPKWFKDRYSTGTDGEFDLEHIWDDLKDMAQEPSNSESVIYSTLGHFQRSFGGYCDGVVVTKEVFDPNTSIANPWKDGGC